MLETRRRKEEELEEGGTKGGRGAVGRLRPNGGICASGCGAPSEHVYVCEGSKNVCVFGV